MKRVLLTGAAGFIGRHALAPLLAAGYEVHALDLKQVVSQGEVIWHDYDMLVPGLLDKALDLIRPTHLLHLAWCTTPGLYWTSPDNFRWLQASLHLLERFQALGGQRVVMAGTCAEYDWRYGYCKEGLTPLEPATLYGACKNSLQRLLSVFAKQVGLSQGWGRIFLLYGPHEQPSRLVASVICSLLQGQTAKCTHGRQIRDFLHVQDVADAFVALLASDVQGPVNIGSGTSVHLQEVVEQIGEILDRSDLLALGTLSAPPSDPPVLLPDTARLVKEVGWTPKFDLDSGLRETIAWWRHKLGLADD